MIEYEWFQEVEPPWKWIANRCKELGLEKSSKIAKEIFNTLVEGYGDTITRNWTRYKEAIDFLYDRLPREGKIKLIKYIATRLEYIKGCDWHDNLCKDCWLREVYGECYGEQSILSKFCNTLPDTDMCDYEWWKRELKEDEDYRHEYEMFIDNFLNWCYKQDVKKYGYSVSLKLL